MKEEHKKAFEAAWLDPTSKLKLLKLAIRYAKVFQEAPEDLLQRTFLALWKGEGRWTPGDDVVFAADREMRNMSKNERRLKKHEVMVDRAPARDDEGDEVPHEDPGGAPDAERVNIALEKRKLREEVWADVDQKLGSGDIAERARVILREKRNDNDDTQKLMEMLGIDETRVYKARLYLAEIIKAVLVRRGITFAMLRDDDDD